MGKRKIDGAKLFAIITNAVKMAEDLFGQKDGQAKRDWVVNTINDLVNIPIIGERTEEVIIGFLVDFVVSVFNENGWGKQ